MVNNTGILVISLDFELNWGMLGKKPPGEHRPHILGARQAIPPLLKLFKEFGIHVTWATVGLLFARNKNELLEVLPLTKPNYESQSLCPYRHLAQVGFNEKEDPYHYAPSLIDLILSYPFQEIGCHTFSHYYCLAPGQHGQAFREDMQAAVTLANSYGIQIDSFVFPGNQVNRTYLPILKEMGIKAYRGTRRSYLYKITGPKKGKKIIRILRYLDSYINLSKDNACSMEAISREFPFNIMESQFLRPYNMKIRKLEDLRFHRLLRGLTLAAQRKQVFHLWWHPHNFGVNIQENLQYLKRILAGFSTLRDEYHMISLNMGELAKLLMTDKTVRL